MAGRSPSRHRLVEREARLEQRVACYTRPLQGVQRAEMILYAAEGLANREIAALAGSTQWSSVSQNSGCVALVIGNPVAT